MAMVITINEKNRDNATLKVLTMSCGCKKHVCMAVNSPNKPCSISCDKCRENGLFDPCWQHKGVAGCVRDRIVVRSEYFL